MLAAVHDAVGIDNVVRVVKVVGFVASAPGFNAQPGVVNGASDLFAEVLGEAGRHARSAVGVSELPLDSPVEVEADHRGPLSAAVSGRGSYAGGPPLRRGLR